VRAALGLMLIAAACGGGGGDPAPAHGASGLERSIQRGLAAQLGVQVTRVTCAGDACKATLAGGGELPITVRGLDWQLDGLAVSAAPLEQYLTAVAGDLGIAGKIDCGARVRAAQPGDRIECKLGDGARAWATIQAGGDFTIELAVGADAIAARTAPADEAALEQASVALDHGRDGGAGEGEGEGDESVAPVDAGAPLDAGAPKR
jgi:hypothetical protein